MTNEEGDEQDKEIMRIAGSDYEPEKPSYIPPHGDKLLTAEEFIEIYGETNAELIAGQVVFPGVEYGLRKKGLLAQVKDAAELLRSAGNGKKQNIAYLNTDLNLTSKADLTKLAAAFKTKHARALHVTHCPDGLWRAIFETNRQYKEPEKNIAALLAIIESFDKSLRSVWSKCSQREFNIGYDCGDEPWAFNQGLSSKLLGRMAKAGATLRFTLYPPRTPRS